MKSEALILAREQKKIAQANAYKEIALALIKNPVAEILVGYIAIEYLQSKKIIPSMAGNFAESGILTSVYAQQMAPLMPYIAQAGGDILGALGKLAPVLLAGA